MRFDELHVENFGKLDHVRIPLKAGINVIYGENESGKTTLHTFLRGMLFGIAKKRGRAAKNDVYTSYEPWDDPSVYGGSLQFTCDHKRFNLDRNFARGYERASLVCMEDGELLSLKDGDLDMLLGNISEAVYDNTVSVGQLKSVTQQELVDELKNYMANYQGGGDGELDVRAAQGLLKDRKRQLLQAQEAYRANIEEQRKVLESRMSYLEQELQESARALEEKELKLKELQPTVEAKEEQEQRDRPAFLYLLPVMAVVLAVSLAALVWLPWQGRILAVVLGILLEGILLYAGRRLDSGGKDSSKRRASQRKKEDIRIQREKSEEQKKHLTWELEKLGEECMTRRTALDNLKSECRELEEQDPVPDALENQLRAVDMAAEKIAALSTDMQNRMGRTLKERTSRILEEITEGKYQLVALGESMEIRVNAGKRFVPLERLSRGTVEQVYFAFRMAVSEVLCSQEDMPVILDDVFAMYDGRRLGQALQWLAENRRQTLLFTCHTREVELLDRLNLPYHLVRL